MSRPRQRRNQQLEDLDQLEHIAPLIRLSDCRSYLATRIAMLDLPKKTTRQNHIKKDISKSTKPSSNGQNPNGVQSAPETTPPVSLIKNRTRKVIPKQKVPPIVIPKSASPEVTPSDAALLLKPRVGPHPQKNKTTRKAGPPRNKPIPKTSTKPSSSKSKSKQESSTSSKANLQADRNGKQKNPGRVFQPDVIVISDSDSSESSESDSPLSSFEDLPIPIPESDDDDKTYQEGDDILDNSESEYEEHDNGKSGKHGKRGGVSKWETQKWKYEDVPIEDFVVDDVEEEGSQRSSEPGFNDFDRVVRTKAKKMKQKVKHDKNKQVKPYARERENDKRSRSVSPIRGEDLFTTDEDQIDNSFDTADMTTSPRGSHKAITTRRGKINLNKDKKPPKKRVEKPPKSKPPKIFSSDEDSDDDPGEMSKSGVAVIADIPESPEEVRVHQNDSQSRETSEISKKYSHVHVPGIITDASAMFKTNNKKKRNASSIFLPRTNKARKTLHGPKKNESTTSLDSLFEEPRAPTISNLNQAILSASPQLTDMKPASPFTQPPFETHSPKPDSDASLKLPTDELLKPSQNLDSVPDHDGSRLSSSSDQEAPLNNGQTSTNKPGIFQSMRNAMISSTAKLIGIASPKPSTALPELHTNSSKSALGLPKQDVNGKYSQQALNTASQSKEAESGSPTPFETPAENSKSPSRTLYQFSVVPKSPTKVAQSSLNLPKLTTPYIAASQKTLSDPISTSPIQSKAPLFESESQSPVSDSVQPKPTPNPSKQEHFLPSSSSSGFSSLLSSAPAPSDPIQPSQQSQDLQSAQVQDSESSLSSLKSLNSQPTKKPEKPEKPQRSQQLFVNESDSDSDDDKIATNGSSQRLSGSTPGLQNGPAAVVSEDEADDIETPVKLTSRRIPQILADSSSEDDEDSDIEIIDYEEFAHS